MAELFEMKANSVQLHMKLTTRIELGKCISTCKVCNKTMSSVLHMKHHIGTYHTHCNYMLGRFYYYAQKRCLRLRIRHESISPEIVPHLVIKNKYRLISFCLSIEPFKFLLFKQQISHNFQNLQINYAFKMFRFLEEEIF